MDKEEITEKSVSVEATNSFCNGLEYVYILEFRSRELIMPSCLHIWRDIENPKDVVEFAKKHNLTEGELIEWLNNNYNK